MSSEHGLSYFFFQAEDGIRDSSVTGVQTCALPISILAAFLVYELDKKGGKNSQQSYKLGQHAVAMFVFDSSHHGRDFEEMSERSRPVGDSKPRLIAGDQSPGDQQEKSNNGQENQKTMEGLIIK